MDKTLTTSDLLQRSRRIMPGGVNSPVRAFGHVGRDPIFFKSGEGSSLESVDGKKYVDFCMSFGPLILGHSPKCVVNALEEQIRRGTSFGACHPYEVELAELILKAYPSMEQVRLVNSGTEAVMTAIRLARGVTGRDKILKFAGCYHGHSDGLLVKAGSGVLDLSESSSKGIPKAAIKDTLVARIDDLQGYDALMEKHGGDVACVILEIVPANDGLWIPTNADLKNIFDVAHKHGALVIGDEVITGFRVGLGGATERFQVKPDIITLGKIIGGGLPLAAIISRSNILSQLAPTGPVYQAGTLSGNVLATVAGSATLRELFLKPPYQELEKRTRSFCTALEEGMKKRGHAVHISTLGSIFWISFEGTSAKFPPVFSSESLRDFRMFYNFALERGVYFPPSPYEVSFVSTAHTDAVLNGVLEALCRP